jgi:hypothetical protein
MATTHEIVWMDDGAIGYRCSQATSRASHSVHGVNEGDKVIECETCGLRLKAIWSVRLLPTEEPLTEAH